MLLADGHAKFYSFGQFPLNSTAGALKTNMTNKPRFWDKKYNSDPTKGYFQGKEAILGSCELP